jgi:hypothetical protein
MNSHTAYKYSTLILSFVLAFGFAGAAFAEDDSNSIEANLRLENAAKLRPLKLIQEQRIKFQSDMHESLTNIRDEKKALHIETKIELRDATTSVERRDIIKDAREERIELRTEARDIRGSVRDRLLALLQTHVGTIVKRLNTALEHFDRFVTRIESRIEKLQGRGIDTASAEASLSTSVGLLATAKTDTQALVDLIRSVTDESDAATVKADLRAASTKAIESVKTVHRSLLATVKVLVGLVDTSNDDSSDEVE